MNDHNYMLLNFAHVFLSVASLLNCPLQYSLQKVPNAIQ